MAGVKRAKGLKGKADKLFSHVIRSVGYCEADGYDDIKCSPQLQTAHIISRKYNATRCDTRNAFCMCAAHHRYFTDHPRQFSRFITTSWAQKYYDTVWQRSRTPELGKKIDWEERIAFLEDIKDGRVTLKKARAEYEDN